MTDGADQTMMDWRYIRKLRSASYRQQRMKEDRKVWEEGNWILLKSIQLASIVIDSTSAAKAVLHDETDYLNWLERIKTNRPPGSI